MADTPHGKQQNKVVKIDTAIQFHGRGGWAVELGWKYENSGEERNIKLFDRVKRYWYKDIIELNLMKSLLAKSHSWKLAFHVGTVASGSQDIWAELWNS